MVTAHRMVALVAAAALVLSVGQPALAVVHCVPSVAIDVTCDDDHLTIQGAINDCALGGGDTVLLGAGTFTENLAIDRPLTLRGVSPGAVADPADLLIPGVLPSVLTPLNLTLESIRVTSAFDGLTIRDLRVVGSDHIGTMDLEFGLPAPNVASNLLIDQVAFDGDRRLIFTQGTPVVSGVTITNSAFRCSGLFSGLELWFAASDLTVVNNFVTDCRDSINLGNSGGLFLPVGGTSVVRGNRIPNSGDDGIQVAVSFEDLTVAENLITAASGAGIEVTRTDQPTSVVVRDNVMENGGDGLRLRFFPHAVPGASLVATGNLITGNARGVRVDAISAGDLAGIHVNFNCIEDNVIGAENQAAIGTLDALEDWWGDPLGPIPAGGGNAVLGSNIDFDPFLTTRPRCGIVPPGPPPLDHFQCYKATQRQFSPPDVTLADQFDDFAGRDATLKAARGFCNPVEKTVGDDVTGIADETAHLTCYPIKEGQPKFERRDVLVQDQFEQPLTLTVLRPETLCVPSVKNDEGDLSDLNLDHFKCYKVKTATGTAKFERVEVRLDDQFEVDRVVTVLKPRALCNPVAKTVGSETTEITNPDGHLTCYKIVPRSFSPKRNVTVTNQFGPDQSVKVVTRRTLCVPSSKQLLPPS